MTATIKYGNRKIATANNQTKTLLTANKYVGENIKITDVSGGMTEGVYFYDYDGTLLHSYTFAEWANVSTLPANPSHTGLTAQGWNWTKSAIDTQIANVGGVINVGQNYVTTDGKTRLYVHAYSDSTFFDSYIACVDADPIDIDIDWGDGSAHYSATLSQNDHYYFDHTYSVGGDYIVTISASGDYYFTTYDESFVTEVQLGSSVSSGLINNMGGLVSVPNGITTSYDFGVSSKFVVIPPSCTAFDHSNSSCYAVDLIILPYTCTDVSNGFGCYLSETLTIPYGMQALSMTNSYRIASLIIPSTVTATRSFAFFGDYHLTEMHLKGSVPPTLDGDTAFLQTPLETVYVPQAALATYQADSNWSQFTLVGE